MLFTFKSLSRGRPLLLKCSFLLFFFNFSSPSLTSLISGYKSTSLWVYLITLLYFTFYRYFFSLEEILMPGL